MDKAQALIELKNYREKFGSRYGILTLGVFGSTARNEAAADSDVDVVISLEKPNLLTLSRIRLELEEQLHQRVDLVSYRERMNPSLKKRIQKEGCFV